MIWFINLNRIIIKILTGGWCGGKTKGKTDGVSSVIELFCLREKKSFFQTIGNLKSFAINFPQTSVVFSCAYIFARKIRKFKQCIINKI